MSDSEIKQFTNIDSKELAHYLKVYRRFWLTIPGSANLIVSTTKTQVKTIILEQPDDCVTDVALEGWEFIVKETRKMQS